MISVQQNNMLESINKEKTRDFYFDNLKAILIFLVVFGHLLEGPLMSNIYVKYLYNFIYIFHMPLFVFTAGYFSKKKKFSRLFSKLLLPYFIIQTAYFLYRYFILNDISDLYSFNLFHPTHFAWFLLSLFVWKVLTPLLESKYSLLAVIILSLIAGYCMDIGGFMSLSRTFYFFPFFVIGFKFNKDKFLYLFKNSAYKIAAILILLSILYLIIKFNDSINFKMLYGTRSYVNLGYEQWYAGAFRIIQYVVTVIMSAALLLLIPKKKNIFTYIGSRTLGIYLFHQFIVQTIRVNGYFENIPHYAEFLVIPLALLITFLFSLKFWTYLTSPSRIIKKIKSRKLITD